MADPSEPVEPRPIEPASSSALPSSANEVAPIAPAPDTTPDAADTTDHDDDDAYDPNEGEGSLVALMLFLALFAFSLGLVFWLFSGYTTDFILGAIFAAICLPMYRWLLVRLGGRTWIASSLVCMLIAFGVAIPVTFLTLSLSQEAATAYSATKDVVSLDSINEYAFGDGVLARNVKRVAEQIGIEWTPTSVKAAISSASGTIATFLYDQIKPLVSNLFGLLIHFSVMLLFVFYLLIDGARFKDYVLRLSPLPDEHEELIGEKFKHVGLAILIGNGVGSVVQGILGGIAMALAGIGSPVLWGTVMAIFAFLPLVGVSVVVIPATGYLILAEKYLTAAIFFTFCMAQGFFVENVVKTKMIGSHMKMHNLLIFMSIIAGLSLFGILGILYGPLVVAIFMTLSELYSHHYKRHLLSFGKDLVSR